MKSQRILGQINPSTALPIWTGCEKLVCDGDPVENLMDVDVQAAAVRMISRAQWFLMSLPIATVFQAKGRSRKLDNDRTFVRHSKVLRSRLVFFVV